MSVGAGFPGTRGAASGWRVHWLGSRCPQIRAGWGPSRPSRSGGPPGVSSPSASEPSPTRQRRPRSARLPVRGGGHRLARPANSSGSSHGPRHRPARPFPVRPRRPGLSSGGFRTGVAGLLEHLGGGVADACRSGSFASLFAAFTTTEAPGGGSVVAIADGGPWSRRPTATTASITGPPLAAGERTLRRAGGGCSGGGGGRLDGLGHASDVGDLDLAGFGLFGHGDGDGQHTVVVDGADVVPVEAFA